MSLGSEVKKAAAIVMATRRLIGTGKGEGGVGGTGGTGWWVNKASKAKKVEEQRKGKNRQREGETSREEDKRTGPGEARAHVISLILLAFILAPDR